MMRLYMTQLGSPYRSYNDYLKEKFGEKVYKVSLDAGFDCPNRDGTLAVGGCTYCDEGSRAPGIKPELSIREQLLDGMERMRKRYGAQKFIAYFQAFTNTYDRVDTLRKRYFEALDHPDIVGLSVSTRPDTLSQGALDLLDEIGQKYLTWLEIGLQTIHDKTNEKLNRWHTYKQFEQALFKAKKKIHLNICVHLILGLPGESLEQMHQTIDTVVRLPIDGLKLHMLHVIKNTKRYEECLKGDVPIFEEDKYVQLICDILEKIPSRVIIHRLTGDAAPDKLIAPRWALEKGRVLHKIKQELLRRRTVQGTKAT
ncbi:MAG: TIGR01212 family radical SAM protein [Deltaproteobacteria bacterium]|nr:TIGR01212 family radical SAM protein [Deltaproteobacteria bacterium]